jgi:putative heme-binding domain-containing protein
MFSHKTPMRRQPLLRVLLLFPILIFSINTLRAEEAKTLTEAQRLEIAFEALSRIKGDIQTNAELKTAVYKLLDRLHGKPQFVQIVHKFQIKDQDAGLLEIAEKNPANENGVEAMRLILENDNRTLLKNALDQKDSLRAAKVAEALGNTKEKRAVPLLSPLVVDTPRDVVLRKMALKALAQTQEGATDLLNLAKEEKLPADLKLTASTELNSVRWQKIKAEAEKVLPLPQGQNAQPLPPISELAKMKGDVAKGENVFFRELSMCSKCHRVKDRGGDIGPNLSEIGTKLGKDALFEAIIEPSAGISLGYEASSLELKSGDEAYGIIVSDSENEVAVKDLNGIVTHHKKSDIAKRKLLKTSLMPNGLTATMSTQELADLVEFLSGLKKVN